MQDLFNIPDDCESTQPYCEDCPDGGPCDEIVGAECVFYHFGGTPATKLINLGLPNKTSSERIFERIDELVGSYFQIPITAISTPSVELVASGTAKHTVKANVRISSRANNILKLITGGPEKGLYASSNADYKVKVDENDVPNYLENQLVGGTDGIVSITVKTVDGLSTIVPTINICGLVDNIINNGDLIDSIIDTILNDPTFFSELLEAILNNEEFLNSLTEAIVNNPTFLTSLLDVLENNPQFFEDFFDIIADNPDLLAALCELISNCPGSCSGSDLNVTINCSGSTFNSTFLQGTPSSGTVTVPITVTGSGVLNVQTASGTAFSGNSGIILDETDTSLMFVVFFDGTELVGTYPVELIFSGANDPIANCIVDAEVVENICIQYEVTPDVGETAIIDFIDCSGDPQHVESTDVGSFCALEPPTVLNGTTVNEGPCEGNINVINANGGALNTITAVTANGDPVENLVYPIMNSSSDVGVTLENTPVTIAVTVNASETGKRLQVTDGLGFVTCQNVTVGTNTYTFPSLPKSLSQTITISLNAGTC